jgi:hypothetical protein
VDVTLFSRVKKEVAHSPELIKKLLKQVLRDDS